MDLEVDFGKRLRASEGASIQRVAIYLPDSDSSDAPIELAPWVTRAIHVLTDLNGGCTRLPMAYGTWCDDSENITFEHTVIIYSYIRNARAFFSRLDEFVAFVHDFGVKTKQNAVMVEFSGGSFGRYFNRAYFIKESDYLNL